MKSYHYYNKKYMYNRDYYYKNSDNDQHIVWGWNETGQLGYNSQSKTIVKEPTALGDSLYFDSKVLAIGLSHSLVIDSRGKLYSTGKGAYGRLGLGDTRNSYGYTQINIEQTEQQQQQQKQQQQNNNGYYYSSSLNYNNPINNYIKVNKIACGGAHSAFITEYFQLYTFGKNDQGQLGQGLIDELVTPKRVEYTQYEFDKDSGTIKPRSTNYIDNVDLVACGLNHTVFSLKDGCLYSMGSNKYCQLGFVSESSNDKVDSQSSPILEHRPKLIDSINKPIKHLEQRFTNIKSISCGSNFTAIVKQGNLYTWGVNNLGQCGFTPKDNDLNVIKEPTLLVIYGDKSTLSTENQTTTTTTNKKVFHFIQVSCGVDHGIALTSNGQVFGWGDNKYGQIGQNNISNVIEIDTTTPIRIGESLISEFVTQVATGAYHSLALSKSGHIYAWGLNDYYQIGENGNKNGQQKSIHAPYRVRIPTSDEKVPILQIAAGGRSSMAIKYYPAKVDKRPSTYLQDIIQIYDTSSFSDLTLNIVHNHGDNKPPISSFKLNKLFWNRSPYLQELKCVESLDTNRIEIENTQFSKTFGNKYLIREIIYDLYVDAPIHSSFTNDSLSEYLFSMVNQIKYSDVKIKVVIKDPSYPDKVLESTIFNSHKCILVNRSEKFKTLLQSSYFKESIDGIIVIDDCSSIQVYETYLNYLYTDQLNLNNENVIELFLLSHQESQHSMKDRIEEYLFNSLDVDNVSNIFELALQLNDVSSSINVNGSNNFLVEQCIFFIAKNLKQVEKTESFQNLSQDSKNLLLTNSINVEQSNSNNNNNNTKTAATTTTTTTKTKQSNDVDNNKKCIIQ